MSKFNKVFKKIVVNENKPDSRSAIQDAMASGEDFLTNLVRIVHSDIPAEQAYRTIMRSVDRNEWVDDRTIQGYDLIVKSILGID